MKFEPHIYPYLNDKAFIGSLHVKISTPSSKPKSRIDYLTGMAEGKKIIHLGCVDHLPLVDQKMASNTWLHKLLDEKADRCLGIDINAEGINYMKKIGFEDCLAHDMIADKASPVILDQKWDFLILGELMEHIDNPVQFLSQISLKYGHVIDKVLITVPNGFRWVNIKKVFRNKEVINSDHRFWYTPYTLAKVCTQAGLKVEEFSFLLDYKMVWYSFITKTIYRLRPALLDNLSMIARFS
ncbi:MAG: hypothetical protein P1P86_00425 [Bacteroidales bacterium]|nr:hypothetical protein [Bacteroidales bacterium]